MRYLFAIILAASLSGCGGGGGGDSVIETPAIPLTLEGFWNGTVTSAAGTFTARVVIPSDGQAVGAIFDSNGNLQEMVKLTVDDTLITSGLTANSTYGHYDYLGQGLLSGNGGVSVNVGSLTATAASLNLGIKPVGYATIPATASLTRDNNYNKPASLAIITGNYVGIKPDVANQSLSIDTNGAVVGGTSGCSFLGQVSVLDPAKNVYVTTGTFSGVGCYYAGTATGITTVDHNGSGVATGITTVMKYNTAPLIYALQATKQ